MKIDKDIYVDVNGVLTRETWVNDGKGSFEFRDNYVEFLKFLVENFKNVYWFTSNREFCLEYFPLVVSKELSKEIIYLGYSDKKWDTVDYSRPFYIFDDELEYNYWQEWGFLKDDIPMWKREPYISRYNPKMHTMYYIPTDAPMNILNDVILDIKKREKID